MWNKRRKISIWGPDKCQQDDSGLMYDDKWWFVWVKSFVNWWTSSSLGSQGHIDVTQYWLDLGICESWEWKDVGILLPDVICLNRDGAGVWEASNGNQYQKFLIC